MTWGNPQEKERRRRIMVAVAAYAYEILDDPIMPDAEFDELCRSIKLERKTGNPKMDTWFTNNFQPHTGMWVRQHPNKDALLRIATFILEVKHGKPTAIKTRQTEQPKLVRAPKRSFGKRPGAWF